MDQTLKWLSVKIGITTNLILKQEKVIGKTVTKSQEQTVKMVQYAVFCIIPLLKILNMYMFPGDRLIMILVQTV